MNKTPLQMCEDLKAKLQLPESAEDIFQALTPCGEFYPLMNTYLHHFAAEVLPTDVPNPEKGDLRWRDRQQVWTGTEWVDR